MSTIDDEMNEVVTCKYCGGKTLYGELTWLAGKCMCPSCYQNERAKQDAELAEIQKRFSQKFGGA